MFLQNLIGTSACTSSEFQCCNKETKSKIHRWDLLRDSEDVNTILHLSATVGARLVVLLQRASEGARVTIKITTAALRPSTSAFPNKAVKGFLRKYKSEQEVTTALITCHLDHRSHRVCFGAVIFSASWDWCGAQTGSSPGAGFFARERF